MFFFSLSPRHACRIRLRRSLCRPLLEWLEHRLVPSISSGTILVATAPSPYASTGQSSVPAGIVAVDPGTGSQSPLSVGGWFSLPTYIAEAADQQLYVSDLTALGTGAIIHVDPNTGQQSLVASGGYINGPNALVWINGFIYVANEGDGSGAVHSLVRIDPRSGAQTLITKDGGFLVPTGMAPAPGNNVYLADEQEDFRGTQSGRIWKINLDNGQQTVLSQGGLLNHPVDVAVDANGNVIVANTGSAANNVTGSLFRLDPGSRTQTLITAFSPYSGTDSVTVGASGTLFVGAIATGSAPGRIITVDPATGAQSSFASGHNLSLVEGMACFSVNPQTGTTTTLISSANPQTAGQSVRWSTTVAPSDSVNFVNFETGDFSQSAAQTHAALVTSPVLDGSYSLQLQRAASIANCEIRQSGTTYYDLPTAYYSFDFEWTSNPGEACVCNFLDTSGGLKGALHLNGSNQLVFYDSKGNLQAVGSTVLQPGSSYSLSAALGTGGKAAWEIRINGSVEMSGTANLASKNNGALLLGGSQAYTSTYYYDDVAINSQGYPGPVPTGTVQFSIDGVPFGTPVALSDGSAASVATSGLGVGNHIITASYSGDSTYAPSTGSLSSGQTINPQPGQVNFVNFETGDFSQSAAQTHAALVTSPVLDGSYSLQLQRAASIANCEIRQSGTTYYDLPTAYYSFDFEWTSNPGEACVCNFLDTSGGLKGALHLNGSNQLVFYDSKGNLQAVGSTVLQPGSSYSLSAALGTGGKAAWEIRINGSVEMSGTANLTSKNNGALLLGGSQAYTSTYYYDDVAINSQGYPGGGDAPVPARSPTPVPITNTGSINAAFGTGRKAELFRDWHVDLASPGRRTGLRSYAAPAGCR